ncbi:MAG: VIT1/CCC1 transporter family protein [Candidatus Micrarchaeia archaeon]
MTNNIKTKKEYFRRFYEIEKFHKIFFGELAAYEKNKETKNILKKMSEIEEYHEKSWLKLSGGRPRERLTLRGEISLLFYKLFRKIFGIAVTTKLLEQKEVKMHRELLSEIKKLNLTSKEKRIVKEVEIDGDVIENALKARLIKKNTVLMNIRNAILGMNDGLVEVLAASAGLATALDKPILVFIGGFIVAVSGMLSMAGGAYLSAEAEEGINKKTKNSPKESALYVGFFYILGAIFPLLPFLSGIQIYKATALAAILTAILLSASSSIIALLTDTDAKKRITKTLLISMGAAAITFILGYYCRVALRLPI